MKNLNIYLYIFLASLLGSSCIIIEDDDGFGNNCVRGLGNDVIRDYSIRSFDGVVLLLDAEVEIRQNNFDEEITVIGPANVLDELDFEVRSGILYIDTRRCIRDANLLFEIELSRITYIENLSSGFIYSQTVINENDLEVRNAGSGDISLGIDVDDVFVDVDGSGDVILDGQANDLNLSIRGSGDFRGFDLDCLDAEVTINGSGDASVLVEDDLDVVINGSGNLRYRGFPNIRSTINGSGTIIDAN